MIYTLTLNPAFDIFETIESTEILETDKQEKIVLAAGKGVNVGRFLYQLGMKVENFVLLGNQNAMQYLSSLHRQGLHVRPIFIEGRVRENIKRNDLRQSSFLEINEKGLYVDPLSLKTLFYEIDATVAKGDLFIVSGSLPGGIDEDWLMCLFKTIISKGGRLIVDMGGQVLKNIDLNGIYLIKPNRQEFIDLLSVNELNSEIQITGYARELIGKGLKALLVSLDKDGVFYKDKDNCFKAKMDVKTIVNTTGAGDALVAAVAESFIKGRSAMDSVICAVSLASFVVANKPGTPLDIQEINGLKDKVQIISLSK
ncbi:MAG: hypothetical protein GX587_09115 [Bacteroidales bacterium]|nr:hypothetical protein [Bacteroidales bacterium]